MAITKAAKKAIRQNRRRRVLNLRKRTKLKNLLKEVKTLISSTSQEKAAEAKKLLPQVYKLLDKAAKTGLIKKGEADRRKSRIAKALK